MEEDQAQPVASDLWTRRLDHRFEWRNNRLSLVLSIKPKTATPAQAMDITQSPLTLQSRPDVFEPKVVTLYRELFREVEDHEPAEGFWRELFLLKPDIPRLVQILEDTDANFLLHIETHTRHLLLNGIAAVKAKETPSDENALDTLTAFFAVILAKKYTNPSSDIIEVLAGLDDVDAVFTDLVTTLESTIRDSDRVSTKQKAVKTAMAVVAGGHQTALTSYFIHKDFFPALMRLVASHDSPLDASVPFLLIGLLANYDKFESASNSYRTRFGDFVNDKTMGRITECVGWTSTLLRDLYVTISDDTPASWSIGGTLSYVGLGSLAGAKPVITMTEEEQKIAFNAQPGPQAAILLPLYDFVLSNKLFAQNLILHPSVDKSVATPFSSLLSFMSYLLQHAYRSNRAGWYAYMCALILYILMADPQTSKSIITTGAPVRLCRQKAPFLPVTKPDRPYIAAVIDIAIDAVNHNLRKKLDATLYSQLLAVLLRCLDQLARSQTKLQYHWSELWRSLLSFARFLATYPDDVKSQLNSEGLASSLITILSISLRSGESFVPNSKEYDDLVYKLVESEETLGQLRDAYAMTFSKESKADIDLLLNVSKHYRALIDEKHGGRLSQLSPREVAKVIKQGYESLSIADGDVAVRANDSYREADHKSSLKRMLRIVLSDAGLLLLAEGTAVPVI